MVFSLVGISKPPARAGDFSDRVIEHLHLFDVCTHDFMGIVIGAQGRTGDRE